MWDSIHRTHEYRHRDVLPECKYGSIDEVVRDDSNNRPGEFEDGGDVHGSWLESTVVDVHRDESSWTSDSKKIEPLGCYWYSERCSPVRDDDDTNRDDDCCECKSSHRNHFGIMILEEIFRKIGWTPPGSSCTESIECSEELFFSIWSKRYSTRKRHKVSSTKCESNEKIRELWDFLMSDNDSKTYCKYWLEFLYQDSHTKGDIVYLCERHREKESSNNSREERDSEDGTLFFWSKVYLPIGLPRKWGNEDKSENMLKKYERRGWESVEWTTKEAVDSPECRSDDDKKRWKRHTMDDA